jgi:hypothetical protein
MEATRMVSDLLAPLTPAECDLTDFPFMPLMVARLRRSKSWLMAKRQPELGFYMVNLWTAAWHDRPAASLEDDDDMLCELAMCDVKHWPKVRDKVLQGWVKCSDGRLYHPVVAEQAMNSWQSKQDRVKRTEAARQAKLQKRNSVATENVTNSVTENATENVTGSKGQGQGQGQGQGESKKVPSEPTPGELGLDLSTAPPPVSKPPKEASPGLPDWIPRDAWIGFTEMRKARRKPLTSHATLLAIGKLDALRADGNDPRAVLEQSTLRGWDGLFPVDRDRGNGRGFAKPNNLDWQPPMRELHDLDVPLEEIPL